jgi:N-acetylglutamate synthase-like GNAT family acetyltransferase
MQLRLRTARHADREAVHALCTRLDPHDYLPQAWDEWLAAAGSEMLLAHDGDDLVGCLYVALVAPGQAFSQGLRVDPAYRRRGAGSLLMHEQSRRLAARGLPVVRGVTGEGNRTARGFFATVGWTEIAAIRRRRLPAWSPATPSRTATAAPPETMLVSRPGRAFYRRLYLAAQRADLEQAASDGRWHSRDGAHLLLDPPAAATGTWIAAAGGPVAALRSLLRDLAPPWRAPGGLTIEAAADPAVQAMLDELGFEPPGAADAYVVVAAHPGAPTR